MARRVTLLGLLGTLGAAIGAKSATSAEARKPAKRYAFDPAPVSLLRSGQGLVSDKVTVGGRPIGYTHRIARSNSADSGWDFMAGDEDDRYMSDTDNFVIFDISSVSKFDPAIAPYLHAKVGAAIYRKGDQFIVDPLGPPVEH